MSIIYIVSNYGRLIKKGDVLLLKKENDILKTIFPFKTEQLIIIGKIEITSPAMNLLMRHNIDTIFLGSNGRYNGKLAFQTGKNVFLRQRQFQLLEDTKFCLKFSQSIVKGKLKNQLSFMQRIKRKDYPQQEVVDAITRMKNTIKQVDFAESIEQLRGYEGIGARYYFSVFKGSIIQDWAKFNGRSMHPPKDNVNAVLSFLYTMILFRVDAALETIGLDSYVGYLHSLDYGKRSLAYDLMEEYRTPIADTLTTALFNLGVLNEDDFEEVLFSPENDEYPLEVLEDTPVVQEKKGVLLTKIGLTKVITQLERKLDTSFYYQPLVKKITYKKLFFEQIKHFRRVMTGEEAEYKPLVLK